MSPSNFKVQTHPATPVPLNPGERPHDEFDGDVDIRAVGIGPLGTRMAQLLVQNLPGVTYHEIVPNEERESSDDMSVLISSLQKANLVFILTGFDDEHSYSMTQIVGGAACEAGALTLVITPHTGCLQDMPPQSIDGQSKWFDTLFNVSDVSHAVAAITNLMNHNTGIGVDFADIATIMREGNICRMGVGVASGPSRGSVAAVNAIRQLEDQCVEISCATGVLASVHSSGNISMADFDAACKVIHEHVSPDANVIVGVISDENLGGFVKVTLFSVH
jgi:cell division GTPase FtsZ